MHKIFSLYVVALALVCSFNTYAKSSPTGAIPAIPETAPNPQFIRDHMVSLDGEWKFGVGDDPARAHLARTVRYRLLDKTIQVPFAPQSKASGLDWKNLNAAVTWYERRITLPEDWKGGLLHLEGVDYQCDVFVNGKHAGFHKGGYDPVKLDISRWLKYGAGRGGSREHTITVRVQDSSTSRTQVAGKQERHNKEGDIFYKNMSGLWKSTWIEKIERSYIDHLKLEANAAGMLQTQAILKGAGEGYKLRLRLQHERESEPVVNREVAVTGTRVVLWDVVDNVKLWDLKNPHLYFGTVELIGPDGEVLDSVRTYTGFRTFALGRCVFELNGQPFYMQGLLNQAIYPDTLYTPTDEHTNLDYKQTLAHGFTGERRHQTTPRHRDLWLADRMGYWLSVELPSARDLTHVHDRAQALQEWRAIVNAYAFGHPSVFFLVPGNEDWGMLEHEHHRTRANNADREEFQMELGRATEAVAPAGMLYSANDGWRVVTTHKHGRHITHLDENRLMFNIHDYRSAEELIAYYGDLPAVLPAGAWVQADSFKNLHAFGYKHNGRAPVLISEMGGRALVTNPQAPIFAYGKIHTNPLAWAAETGGIIEALGRLPVVNGYVATQTRDAGNDPDDPLSAGEVNGILTAKGAAKVAPELLANANTTAKQSWERLRRQKDCEESLEGPEALSTRR